jgi:S-DNA-T family DNA segregation ATPase FtsK/SpoIIIE
LGVNTQNSPVWIDLYSAPHLLIAGETGAGKSVLVNSIICSVLLKNSPETARFVMIDPKQVEFTAYKNLPHLLRPIITSPRAAVAALESLCDTMEERYTRAAARGLKYSPETPIICIIDELADLMITSRAAVEKYIVRIAQKGRAARIHLIIATQSPRASVITGLIKANMPTKIALTCSNIRESMVILDHGGAEKLTGRGDCILKTPLTPDEIRIQAAYTPEKDIENIVAYWKNQAAPRPARRWPFWK